MQVSNFGPDASSRAALKSLMLMLPGMTTVEGANSIEPTRFGDPPQMKTAPLVEGTVMRAIRVPDFSRMTTSGFGAFLDGAQRVQVVGYQGGIPIVFASVSAAIRVRTNRRLTTWGHQPPRVERKFLLPLRFIPSLANSAGPNANGLADVVDTSKADRDGKYPIPHPTELLDRAMRSVDELREQLEHQLAEAWCTRSEAPLFIDGGISGNPRVASSTCAVGVVKSHRTLHMEGDALSILYGLEQGERSPVFRVSPRSRSSVMSWYLRVRSAKGHDPLWGLVRVEVAETDRPTDRADEISRWVMAEMSPLSLPDGRWDKMAYGIRDCEEFLRAIS